MNEVVYVYQTPHQEMNLRLFTRLYDESQLLRYLEAETVALDQMDHGTRLQSLHAFSLAAECFNRLVRTQYSFLFVPQKQIACFIFL